MWRVERNATQTLKRYGRGYAMGKKRTILLIDDEQSICRMLKMNIEDNEDYQCLVSTSADAGLELVKTHKPDLVLLDILMPGMGGLETLKRIKAMAPEMPVAMVSATRDEREAQQAMQAGAYEYITKPVDFEYLKTVLFTKLFN